MHPTRPHPGRHPQSPGCAGLRRGCAVAALASARSLTSHKAVQVFAASCLEGEFSTADKHVPPVAPVRRRQTVRFLL